VLSKQIVGRSPTARYWPWPRKILPAYRTRYTPDQPDSHHPGRITGESFDKTPYHFVGIGLSNDHR
jgi:hypothetical protein